MKNILIITSKFYPENNIAAIRLKERIKMLAANNYNVYVLTRGEDLNPNWGEKKIYRIGETERNGTSNENKFINKLKGFILSKPALYNKLKCYKRAKVIEAGIAWAEEAVTLAKSIVKKENINIVYSTVPSLDALIVGNELKKEFKDIKYIVEFRDILSFNAAEVTSQATNNIMKKYESEMVPLVDKYIFLTENLYKIYYDRYGINNYEVIYNGYRVLNEDIDLRKDNNIIFSHVGTLYGSRNPSDFLIALGELLNEEEYKQYKNRIKVKFAGKLGLDITYNIEAIINQYNLKDNIEIIGVIDNSKALDIMFKSDVNIIITHSKGSEYAIPGKLFEYIGARKTILALTRDVLVKDIIKNKDFGFVIDNKKEKIKGVIRDILDNASRLTNTIDLEKAKKFSQEYQENKFVQYIDEAVSINV